MRRELARLILLALLVSTAIVAAAPHAAHADESDDLRLRWKAMLTGGGAYDTTDPDVSARLVTISNEGLWHRASMNRASGRQHLWGDLASTTISSHITASYHRLRAMALAYSTVGSSFYQDAAMLADLKGGLDWMHTNRYSAGRTAYDNWWDWQIGTPLALNDITVLLYDQLSAAQKTGYMNAVDHFNPTVGGTGANRVWDCVIIGLRGVIVKSSAKVIAARDGLSPVFDYVSGGDGFHRDGSFIQHGTHPYTGSYGADLLKEISDLMYLLHGSTWSVVDASRSNVFQWVYDAYEPLIYRGAMMDMSRGRAVSRMRSQDHTIGHVVISAIARLSQIAAPGDAFNYKRMIKHWVASDNYVPFYSDTSLSTIVYTKAVMGDGSIPSRGDLVKHKQYPQMDRAVHHRPDFGFAVSMHSTRIKNYESIRNENLKGWHQADGMTYLYNNDLSQFSDNFWPTVDSYRLPGTTVNQNTAVGSQLSPKHWAGGTDIAGAYGTSGTVVQHTGSTLTAKKSWFMFDDEIVALGSGITGTDGKPVETIVENRKLNGAASNALTVNGAAKPATAGWSETMTGVNWAHLAGSVPGADIGYYFPRPASLKALRQTRTGAWNSINTNPNQTDATAHRRNYLTMWFDHGVNPANRDYSYVLLPNKTGAATGSYAASPDIAVLANSGVVHAVREKNLGITAVNFWDPATAGGVRSDSRASVMLRESASQAEVSVSDPTQLNTGVITVEISKRASGPISVDPGVTVLQLAPTLKLAVNVNGAKGKTFRARFDLAGSRTWYSKAGFTAKRNLGLGSLGTHTIEYDVTPLADNIDGVTGYTGGAVAVTGYPSLAMLVRMNPSGLFDVRNGSVYAALAGVGYSAGTTYHVRIVANVARRTYDVFVSAPGAPEVMIANDYAFRSDAPAVADLGQVVLVSGADDQFRIENHPLLFEDFEDAGAEGWSVTGGSWAVVADGSRVYRQATASGTCISSAGNPIWSDYTVRAKVKPLAVGPDYAVGVSARYLDNDNLYAFRFHDGNLEISKKVNAAITILAAKPYTVTPGTVYSFKAALHRTTLEFYVNGVRELAVTDSSHAAGRVGLATYNASAAFDEVIVD